MRRLKLGLAALASLALGSCDENPFAPANTRTGAPAIWVVTANDDKVEGWLFGTIHALPDDVQWRSEVLDGITARADLLVVEAAKLDNSAENARQFNQLALSPAQPDLLVRVPQSMRENLADLIGRSGMARQDFTAVETWAAALMLAQGMRHGESANGVDRALIREFADRPVQELEGVAAQLRIFDALPESEQRDLLESMVADFTEHGDDPDRLTRSWLEGDTDALAAEHDRSMLADPELREALLTSRNEAWSEKVVALFRSADRPLVAVGTAHLVGPDSLPDLLEAQGYRVNRIQ